MPRCYLCCCFLFVLNVLCAQTFDRTTGPFRVVQRTGTAFADVHSANSRTVKLRYAAGPWDRVRADSMVANPDYTSGAPPEFEFRFSGGRRVVGRLVLLTNDRVVLRTTTGERSVLPRAHLHRLIRLELPPPVPPPSDVAEPEPSLPPPPASFRVYLRGGSEQLGQVLYGNARLLKLEGVRELFSPDQLDSVVQIATVPLADRPLFKFHFTDRRHVTGYLLRLTAQRVVFQLTDGTTSIMPRHQLRQFFRNNASKRVASYRENEPSYARAAPPPRYFLTPGAGSLERNTFRYQNTLVLYNEFSYDLNRHLGVGLGSIPLGDVWLNGYVRISGLALNDWLRFGVRLNMLGFARRNGRYSSRPFRTFALMPFGTLTAGNARNHLSVGTTILPAGFSDRVPLYRGPKRSGFTLGGQLQLDRSLYVVGEGLFFGSNRRLLFGGLRLAVRPNVTLDLSLLHGNPRLSEIADGTRDLRWIPWLSVRASLR